MGVLLNAKSTIVLPDVANLSARKFSGRRRVDVKLIISCSIAVVLFVSIVALTFITFPYPLHASCSITWNVSESCCTVSKFMFQQLMCHECLDTPQGCQYKFQGYDNNVLYMTYNAAQRQHDIAIRFLNTNTTYCLMQGISITRCWYVIFDYGINYCGLHNLVSRTGFEYKEDTRSSICTQYNIARCGANIS
ncbi:hypothetical protein L9F63_010341 [Diploptera punctata]|uniref:Uncharacterized protein n=1 Tax=Diploptera punctata TaxID=6984 RepID=A0AAD8AHK6_DIPPU|nr:hypothetical protein L9F63_010341 [Diploptera punctata]